MSLVLFLVSYLNLAPSSRLRHLSMRSRFLDVSGLVSGLFFEPGSELTFATLVDQISSVDVSDLVSGLVSGLVFQPGSEIPFATTVDEIELRG